MDSAFAVRLLHRPPVHFSLIDWLIVSIYLVGTIAAGVYGRRFVTGVDQFLLAGRAVRRGWTRRLAHVEQGRPDRKVRRRLLHWL